MKRIIPFVAAVLVALSAQAQSVSVHMADGTTQKYGASKVDYIDFGAAGVTPAGVETVDLNLPSGLKWASMNVGATAPEEVGAYFALLDQAVTANNDEEFPLTVVPVLTLGYSRFRYIDRELSMVNCFK